MEAEKNRERVKGKLEFNNRFFPEDSENKEDLLKTESVDSDSSSNTQSIPNCNLEMNNLSNFSNFANFTNNFSNNVPTKRRRNLHSTFLLLKKKLNLEQFMRKTQIDSLLKKCKSKAFKTIHEALKKCLNIKLPRLPQNFITNIKIDFNKVYLEKSILEIYREHKIIPSIEEFMAKKYLIEDKVQVFKDFLSLTFRNVFEYYVNSKQYVKDYYHIQQREGEKFAILFNYISKVFIQYYTKSKGNRPKGTKKNSVPSEDGLASEIEYLQKETKETERNELKDSNNFINNINNTNINFENSNKKRKKDPPTQQIKRKPVFKRIKVKRVSLKKKIIKVCDVNTSSNTPIFEIKKFIKRKKSSADKEKENVNINI